MKACLRLVGFLGIALLFVPAARAGEGGKGKARGRRPRTVLYAARKGATASQLAALRAVERKHGLAQVRALVKGRVSQAAAAAGQAGEEAICAELAATGAVAFAEPDYLIAPVLEPNDPRYDQQWQHAKIDSAGAWDVTTGSSEVLTAVLDTGVQSDHPDLAANLQLPGYNSADGSANTEPVHYHGTMVAGFIGAVGNNAEGVTGGAWNVKILPVRITNLPNGSAYISDMAEGIRYAADQGARAVNLSYGGANSSTIDSAAQYLRDRGGLLFMAAGNEGNDGDNETIYPDFASFVAVGATDQNDAKASWSNYGSYIDLVAPGVSVLTTYTSSGYASGSGTSFASPITAGVAALIWSVNPSFTPAQVEGFLFSTAVDLGEAGEDNTFGSGRVNAAAAVAKAEQNQGNLAPTAVASVSPASGVAGGTVFTFDGSGSSDPENGALTCVWNFGDGEGASGAVATHVYASAGTYTATLTVTDEAAASDTDTVDVTVSPDPDQAVHVASIDMALAPINRKFMRATAAVLVVDAGGAPVSGATVTGAWSGVASGTAQGVTGADGSALLTSPKTGAQSGTFTLTVTDVSAGGRAYDPAANVETADSIPFGETPPPDPDPDPDPPPPARTVFVGNIEMSAGPVPGGLAAQAAVLVLDTDNNPVAGARVTGDWTGPWTGSASAVTGADGTALVSTKKVKTGGFFTFTVTDVSGEGCTYNPSLNVEESDFIVYP